jgi:hypothetical protein
VVNGATEINGVPEDDGRDGEIETGSSIPLTFEGAITHFAEPMEEYGAGKSVSRFALFRAGHIISRLRRSVHVIIAFIT